MDRKGIVSLLAPPRAACWAVAAAFLLGPGPLLADDPVEAEAASAQDVAEASATSSSGPAVRSAGRPVSLREPYKPTLRRASARQPEAEESEQPVQPTQPVSFQPESAFGAAGAEAGTDDPFGGDVAQSVDNASPRATGGAAGAAVSGDVVFGGAQVVTRSTTDVGTLIVDSPTASNITVFRRPMVSQPYVRAYHHRQLITQLDGGLWRPARYDLDTIVSKIDSGIVQDVIILKGPYSALYGPALSYIDVVTRDTPRCCCGTVFQGRSSFNYDSNGDGWYGRQILEGGGSNYGYRVNAGFRTANDYQSGDGTNILGSFKHRDLDAEIGYDLDRHNRLTFNYVRLDLTDAQLDNQPTDIDFQVTNGFTAQWVSDCGEYYDRFVVEGWYNRTRVGQSGLGLMVEPADVLGGGETLNILDVDQYADQSSWGYRAAATWGDPRCSHLTMGTDLRYVEQELREETLAVEFAPATPEFQEFLDILFGNFDIPDATSVNPGLFFQAVNRSCRSQLTFGGRVDWVTTDAGSFGKPVFRATFDDGVLRQMADELITPAGIEVPVLDPQIRLLEAPERDFTLWSLFATSEYELSCEWTALFGVGHGQRPPRLTELYADEPFLAGNQRGNAFFVGNPFLDEERATQVDVGLNADYADMRMNIRGFYSWVDDYITFAAFPGIAGTTGFIFVNTDRATLSGFEVNGEYDVNRWLTAFGQLNYTEGRDEEIDQPLFGIYPLWSRVGLRAQFGNRCRGWGVELSSRIVDDQDRLATLRATGGGGLATAAGLRELPTPGFTIYDLRGYVRVNRDLLLTLGVENFTDKNYFEHYDWHRGTAGRPTFQPGRNWFVGGEYTF